MNMLRKIAVGGVSAAIALGSYAPMAFAADLTISGNGNQSTNAIVVNNVSGCEVSQNSNTNVSAVISATSSSGGNTANNNTGDGGVGIDTGNASTTVDMSVTGGNNSATDPCCPCGQSHESSAEIKNNGNKTENAVVLTNTSVMSLIQKAKTKVNAVLSAKSKTGKNKANNNTGGGNVMVETGSSTTEVGLTVEGGSNSN